MREARPLHCRAKFALPALCAALATALAAFGLGLIAWSGQGAANAGAIGSILGSALLALGALGSVGASAQGAHDALRDMGATRAQAQQAAAESEGSVP